MVCQTQIGAYGRAFYTNELASALQTVVAETLRANGYRPTPADGEYRPLPLDLAVDAADSLTDKLAAVPAVTTELGQAILLRDLLTAILGAERAVSDWQAAQLVRDGRVAQALRQLGYQTELTWCQPLRQAQGRLYHFPAQINRL